METESVRVVARDWRGGEDGMLFHGDRASVWEDEWGVVITAQQW